MFTAEDQIISFFDSPDNLSPPTRDNLPVGPSPLWLSIVALVNLLVLAAFIYDISRGLID